MEKGIGLPKILTVVILVLIVISGAYYFSVYSGEDSTGVKYSNIELDSENEVVDYPLSFGFGGDNFYTGKINVSVDIHNPRDSKVIENVELFLADSQSEEKDWILKENRRIELEPNEVRTENFEIIEKVEDNYVVKVGGISKSFRVVNPADNPSLYPDHYYGVAEDYVPREYDMPENKNIEGLVSFLNQIEMPPYESGAFVCSHSTAMLEWVLEGAGFDTDIVVDEPENRSEGKYQPTEWESGHSWVIVNVENRDIAIESIYLGSEAWVVEGEYKRKYYYEPPGIIETSDNYFSNNSIELSDLTDTYSSYYYENIDGRFETAKEFQNEFSYVLESSVNWWGKALATTNIKSSIHDVEPFSSWVFG